MRPSPASPAPEPSVLRPEVRPEAHRDDDDQGSVVAEWAMVAGLGAVLFALTLQLVFALHVRNVLIDAASQGARYGTLADRGPDDAVTRTSELISDSVGARYAGRVSAQPADVDGIATLEVQVVAPLPLVGPFGPAGVLEVSGHAIDTT